MEDGLYEWGVLVCAYRLGHADGFGRSERFVQSFTRREREILKEQEPPATASKEKEPEPILNDPGKICGIVQNAKPELSTEELMIRQMTLTEIKAELQIQD